MRRTKKEGIMYYLRKKYFFPDVGAVWLRVPHWNPVVYATWGEVAQAYVKERLGNVRALGVPGLPASHIDIEHVDYPLPRITVARSAAALDEVVPLWWQFADLNVTPQGGNCRCVMRQLFEICEHHDPGEAEEMRYLEHLWRHEVVLRQLGTSTCEDCGKAIPQTDKFCGPCATMQDWSEGI